MVITKESTKLIQEEKNNPIDTKEILRQHQTSTENLSHGVTNVTVSDDDLYTGTYSIPLKEPPDQTSR